MEKREKIRKENLVSNALLYIQVYFVSIQNTVSKEELLDVLALMVFTRSLKKEEQFKNS